MRDILIGTLMGDGSLQIYEGKLKTTSRFTFAQTANNLNHVSYLKHLFEIFQAFIAHEKPVYRTVKVGIKKFTQIRFDTRSYTELVDFYFIFYTFLLAIMKKKKKNGKNVSHLNLKIC